MKNIIIFTYFSKRYEEIILAQYLGDLAEVILVFGIVGIPTILLLYVPLSWVNKLLK